MMQNKSCLLPEVGMLGPSGMRAVPLRSAQMMRQKKKRKKEEKSEREKKKEKLLCTVASLIGFVFILLFPA